MQIELDCLPCILRQTLDAARLAGADAIIQARSMTDALAVLPDYRQYVCSPALTRALHRRVQQLTGCADPYQAVKQNDIAMAQAVLPRIRQFFDSQANTLDWAVKIAATGNILDSAIYSSVDLDAVLERELHQAFAINDLPAFMARLATARSLLIIGDNAGEAVFDRFLIEHLLQERQATAESPLEVTYAVRANPTLNDVTLDDARAAGLDRCCRLLSSGCDAAGLILSEASAEFLESFRTADLVISKGQGNFEGLDNPGRDVLFLLKAKCPVIARAFAVPLGSYICQFTMGPA
jgi:damage-control phosphatase, subfamily I